MLHFLKRIFRSKSDQKEKDAAIKLVDLASNPLLDGDRVMSLRYGLGECVLRITPDGTFYESIETGEKVSYTRMVDASTNCQKVNKLQ